MLLLYGLALCAAAFAQDDYRTDLAKWRQEEENSLRGEKSLLLAIGRQNVPEGRMAIGSDPASDAVLPSRAPKRFGVVERNGDRITFEPDPGAEVLLNGKRLQGRTVLRNLGRIGADRLESGDFNVSVLLTEESCQLVIRDRQSEYLKRFRGLEWFPPDPAYRVEAAFTPYPEPRAARIADTTGGFRNVTVPGYATFRLHGQELRLEPINSSAGLFFMFKDRTSGKSTYGAGRFLGADLPKDGRVVLDFNRATNPPCSLNPYISCPVTPKQNTLGAAVEAGEKYTATH